MAEKPIIVLDVDGVLNPWVFDPQDCPDWAFEKHRLDGFQVYLSRDMCQALTDLRVDIFWLSTWMMDGDLCNSLIAPAAGLPQMPCLPLADYTIDSMYSNGPSSTEKKAAAMTLLVAKPGPKVIWIDDDAFDIQVFDPHERILRLVPNAAVGLTKDNIQEIQEILGAV